MVTALALQLIQCVVKLPQPKNNEQPSEEEQIEEANKAKKDKHGKNKRKSNPVSWLCDSKQLRVYAVTQVNAFQVFPSF